MKRTKQEVIKIIQNFINGKDGARDWDDFISIRLKDRELEKIRLICCVLLEKFPSNEKKRYCSSEGVEVLRKIILELKNNIPITCAFEEDLKGIKQKEFSNKIAVLMVIILFLALIVREILKTFVHL